MLFQMIQMVIMIVVAFSVLWYGRMLYSCESIAGRWVLPIPNSTTGSAVSVLHRLGGEFLTYVIKKLSKEIWINWRRLLRNVSLQEVIFELSSTS